MDMANVPGIAGFVIQVTVLAPKMAHYPAAKCRNKMMQISLSKSILGTISVDLILAPRVDGILTLSVGNSSPPKELPGTNIASGLRKASLHKQEMVSHRTGR
jgi:hypothetical protein